MHQGTTRFTPPATAPAHECSRRTAAQCTDRIVDSILDMILDLFHPASIGSENSSVTFVCYVT